MYGYKCFYKDKELEVYADTVLQAQNKAALIFKARKPYEISVILCEKNGETITHSSLEGLL